MGKQCYPTAAWDDWGTAQPRGAAEIHLSDGATNEYLWEVTKNRSHFRRAEDDTQYLPI